MSQPILIVDDYDDILFLIKLTLESEGYRVNTATNGREALELARQLRPRSILMDVMMPKLNGFEVARQIRQDRELSSTQILLVSANHQITSEEARANGANDIIYKPFNLDYLLSQVRQSLASDHLTSRKLLTQPV